MADPDGPIGPTDASLEPRFAGLATFARLPMATQVAQWDVGIVGIPFDGGTSYRPGARFGPAAVRQASRLLRPYHPAADAFPSHWPRWSTPATSPVPRSAPRRR